VSQALQRYTTANENAHEHSDIVV